MSASRLLSVHIEIKLRRRVDKCEGTKGGWDMCGYLTFCICRIFYYDIGLTPCKQRFGARFFCLFSPTDAVLYLPLSASLLLVSLFFVSHTACQQLLTIYGITHEIGPVPDRHCRLAPSFIFRLAHFPLSAAAFKHGTSVMTDAAEPGEPLRPGVSSNEDVPPSRTGHESEQTRRRRSRLKLKSRRSGDRHEASSHSDRRHQRRRRRPHRSPSPHRHHGEADTGSPQLDPEAAFRESLFDAMADDEGASYWESVYGQPIHIYSNEQVGPTGELEQMTDEQYATHVRQKMWEKTHAGLLEERARREEKLKQQKEEERRARRLQRELDESLRLGEERRQRKRQAAQWEAYNQAWSKWDGNVETLAWPVEGNERKDMNEKNVRAFYSLAQLLERRDELTSKMKEERVRWHPDKMQQRLGGQVDGAIMKDITAVFQIVDQLWSEWRSKR